MDADGRVKYKARLVAQGYRQKKGLDYNETYSPVASLNVMKTLLAVAAQKGWVCHQMDFNSAYLNAPLHEDIYMCQPEGFVEAENETKCCKLSKSLYGLKQAGRDWNIEMNRAFEDDGLVRSELEPCVYTCDTKNGQAVLGVFVDDSLIIAENDDAACDVKKRLSSMFPAKDLGQTRKILGINVSYKNGAIIIDQKHYVEEVLQKYGMMDCRPCSTPMEVGTMQNDDTNDKPVDKTKYKELIGSLQYLAHGTRPDIAYPVSRLSRCAEKPTMKHWKELKRVLRYLRGTTNHGILMKKSEQPVVCYVDADWGSDIVDRKSYTGYCLQIGDTPIIWKCIKQTCVASSTMEAEYIALAEGVKEVMWCRQFFAELNLCSLKMPTAIRCDNQAAIHLASNYAIRSKSKHIDLRYHAVRDAVMKKTVEIVYVPTNVNKADLFTKPLNATRMSQLLKMCNVGNTCESV